MSQSPSFKLLVEQPCYDVKYLVEEQNRNTPSSMFIKGPFLMAEEVNKNKRRYPLGEMVTEVSRYTSEMIGANRAMGELNHPSTPEINLERACHLITELKQDGNIFHGKSKVLSTPMGTITRNLIMDGVKVGVSSRALGQLIQEGNVNRVSKMKLVAVDIVADPSAPSAFVNGILESKEWIVNNKGEFEPVYEKFEKSFKNLSVRQDTKDSMLKENILSFINALKKM